MSADVWTWVVGGIVVWVLVSVALAVLIGRGIRLADLRAPGTGAAGPLGNEALPVRAPVAARRRLPLPPVGVALAAVAVALETTGFVLRSTGATGSAAQVLSLDAPYSVPRLFVASLFATAAVFAVAGAGRMPARRGFWLAVGLVAAGIAVVKTGSTVHAEAVQALAARIGDAGALAVGAVLALAVLAVLAFLTRAERRDRRRVLGTLACYAGASVGLSALSAVAGSWYAAATYLEESGEALAGVTFLVAVLVGVAPRLVLPADLPLRRRADAETLDADVLPLPRRHRSATDR